MAAWTDERVEILKKLWAEGYSAGQVALRLGGRFSRSAVIGKVHRLGLKGRDTHFKAKSRASGKTARITKPAVIGSVDVRGEFAPYHKPGFSLEQLNAKQIDDVVRVESLADLEERQCRWPIGDPKSEDFGWCGDKKVPGRPYCEGHCARAYESPAVRKRKTRHGEGDGFRFGSDNTVQPEKEVENVDT